MTAKILALCGSCRTGSLNQMLLDVAGDGARSAGAQVSEIRLADFQLPFYDTELEATSGLPLKARELQDLFASHDGVIFASPEYNGGYTAVLKNALDWVSRPRADGSMGALVFVDKLAAVISASPGPLGGTRSQIALKMVLDKLGMTVIPQGFALGMAHQAFDDSGAPKDAKVAALVAGVGVSLARACKAYASTKPSKDAVAA
jgi:NAD(P)H-dependent FMN reductase